MKFTFDKNALINEISIAQEIIASKASISILSNVLLIAQDNSLTIKATDIKANFQTKIPIDIEEEGSSTVPCDKLMGILSALPEGECIFETQEKDNLIYASIRHSTRKIKYQVRCLSQENFPEIAIAQEVNYFDVPAKDLKAMITQTIFAVSTKDDRPFLMGVCFKKKDDSLVLVSTDSHRLAYAEKNILSGVADFSEAKVLPKILNIVSKHASNEGNISIAIVEQMIFFKFANYEFSSVLVDGQYPRYEKVIPHDQPHFFKILRTEFLESLKRISIMTTDIITLTLNPGVLTIMATAMDSSQKLGDAKEEIPCEYAGEEISISVFYKHVDSPLKVIDSEYVTFEFTDDLKPIKLRPEPEADYFHVIMPVQGRN